MAVWRLWMLCFAVLLVLESHSGLKIIGCESGSMDIVESTSPSFTCGTFWRKRLYWKASADDDEDGKAFDLGYCNRDWCEHYNNQFQLDVEESSQSGFRSVLTISEIKRDTARRIFCENQETKITCTLRVIGLKITNCVNGSVDVVQDTSPSFTCGAFWDGGLKWVADEWTTFYVGSCDSETCTRANDKYYLRLKKSSSGYWSELTIENIDRHTARSLSCINYAASTPCILRIIVYFDFTSPARIFPGNCGVTISNWQVQGSCQVENMYMLKDNYTCTWRENNATITGGFEDHREYYGIWPRRYWKKVCSFSKTMPADQKQFTYTIEIDPGSQDFVVETINIIRPRQPEYNCKDTVLVGSNVNCTCTSLNMGNPPAKLVWDGETDEVLLLQDVRKENVKSSYTCRLTWGPNGFINQTIEYTLRVVENEQKSAASMKGGIIGGVVAVVIIITIIGTITAVYIVKRRKGTYCKGKISLRFWPCPINFCHQKKPLSQSCAVVNTPQTPITRHAAPSGDLYTVVMTMTSSDDQDEYVTLRKTINNTAFETDGVCNLQTNEDVTETTESRTNPTTKSTAGRRSFSDLSGTGYMNITEVPTDSGLGVYHIVPWAVMPTPQPDTRANYEAVISEEEYNVLQFEEDRTGQEDRTPVYHHLQHK